PRCRSDLPSTHPPGPCCARNVCALSISSSPVCYYESMPKASQAPCLVGHSACSVLLVLCFVLLASSVSLPACKPSYIDRQDFKRHPARVAPFSDQPTFPSRPECGVQSDSMHWRRCWQPDRPGTYAPARRLCYP